MPPVKGIYIKDFDKKPIIYIYIGKKLFYCDSKDFYNGVDLLKPYFSSCTNTKLILGVKNNRVYVSAEFKDLKNGETIGVLDFNQWKVLKVNSWAYPKNNDERLEVRDREYNIVFSIRYEEWGHMLPAIIINGYFVNDSSVMVIHNDSATSLEGHKC